MARPPLEVADVIRAHRDDFLAAREGRVSALERRLLDDLVACRTAARGGHVQQCAQCGQLQIAYNSCRNRHCPKCQQRERAEWLADRQAPVATSKSPTCGRVKLLHPEAAGRVAS